MGGTVHPYSRRLFEGSRGPFDQVGRLFDRTRGPIDRAGRLFDGLRSEALGDSLKRFESYLVTL